jgi:histone-lysine N-methyltransferase SETD2
MELKDDSETSGSGSNTDSDAQTVKRGASPDVPAGPSRTTSSNKSVKQSSPSKKPSKTPVQLIAHYPRADDAALATFETLETNWHQYKYLGKSKVQEDAMACECYYKPGLQAVLFMARHAKSITLQVTPSTQLAVHVPIVSTD